MELTVLVKEELSRVEIRDSSIRKAEVSAMLRYAGGLQLSAGCVVIQAEVDLASTGKRLCSAIADIYGRRSEMLHASAGGTRPGGRYIVRIVHDSESLARQTGLLDSRGNPIRGMSPAVVNGSASVAAAAWRGAFLAQGSLTEQSRSSVLGVTCPGPEAALALVGTARRQGIEAKTREVRGVDRVLIRDYDSIAALLTRMGAGKSLTTWQEKRRNNENKAAAANRVVSFETSNQRRTTQAAVAVSARVELALGILGDDAPEHLKDAGELRLAHRHASLDELGRLADPPMSKDSIAGRIRRLLVTADKRASELGIPVQLIN